MRKTELYQKSSGNSAQFVDHWFLVYADDGTYQVEYQWINKMGLGRKDVEGSAIYSINEALNKAPAEALDALKRELDI